MAANPYAHPPKSEGPWIAWYSTRQAKRQRVSWVYETATRQRVLATMLIPADDRYDPRREWPDAKRNGAVIKHVETYRSIDYGPAD